MENKLELYLESLSLQNFATFSDQQISFTNGFNGIVGETGSGKSLILDALQLILGHRAKKELIRNDCDFSTVEAVFRCSDEYIKSYFFEKGFPFDGDEIIIKRILFGSGKTKSYLNHSLCSLSILSEFSKKFIDLVGQFENQKLLSEGYQLSLLDFYSQNHSLRNEYQKSYTELTNTMKERDRLFGENSQIQARLDYISFQIRELETLGPCLEEEKQLKADKLDLTSIQKVLEKKHLINGLFEGSEQSSGLLSQLSQLESYLSSDILSMVRYKDFLQAKEIIDDISYTINSSSESDFSEEKYEEIIDTLDHYQKLKRKFNVDTEGLINLLADFRNEQDQLVNIDQSLEFYQTRVNELENQSYKIATDLHENRMLHAISLSKELSTSVRSLRMEGATLKIQLEKNQALTSTGFSSIQFLAETNPGEGFGKIKDIASGGELSRILLSVRKVLASKDSISIFLFDEIDTGIGGETALTIGNALSEVSETSQVIAITHLPQIADFSQKLIKVTKVQTGDNRTISMVHELTGTKIREEVISMNPLS